MTRGLFGPGPIVLGGGAVLLLTFLGIGFLLPGGWSASAERTIPAEAEAVLALIDAPEGWLAWTPWPDSTTRSGPERGAGAQISWDNRELGAGRFRIEDADSRGVRYSVSVAGEGGSGMDTRGSLTLEPVAGGTRVRWIEEGDLGNNPLMGYWALAMDRAQSAELGKSLDRLAEVVDEAASAPSAPTPDSVRSR
jgi:carbon monoxide dehydrogenase subunit G